MKVVQCWDDGVTTDIRLTEILRRHGAKATFNLNAGLHGSERVPGWRHLDTDVQRLAAHELVGTYRGFTIANHSLTHPHLDEIDPARARWEIVDGRRRLQEIFAQPVSGFALPFGTFNSEVLHMVQDAGHVYARMTQEAVSFRGRPSVPTCHVLAPDFRERYEAARARGVFHFWGHSYELVDDAMWVAFEATIRGISADPAAEWAEIVDVV